jgi:hypothetical protein
MNKELVGVGVGEGVGVAVSVAVDVGSTRSSMQSSGSM